MKNLIAIMALTLSVPAMAQHSNSTNAPSHNKTGASTCVSFNGGPKVCGSSGSAMISPFASTQFPEASPPHPSNTQSGDWYAKQQGVTVSRGSH